MALSAPLPVLALSMLPAVLWGFTPVIEKRARSNGGTPVQASVTVGLVDSTNYRLAIAAFRDDPFDGSKRSGCSIQRHPLVKPPA